MCCFPYVLNKNRLLIALGSAHLLCSAICLLEHWLILVRGSLAAGQVSASVPLPVAIAHFDAVPALAALDEVHMQEAVKIL